METRKTDLLCDGLIFDVDGTLWDATKSLAEAYSDASKLNAFGPKTFSQEQIKSLLGLAALDIFEVLYPEIHERYPREEALPIYEQIIADAIRCEYALLAKKGGALYEGLYETLSYLYDRVPLYIVSNCESGYIELFLEYTGYGHFFRDHSCYGDTGLEKDGTISLICQRNGIGHPVYVGDILKDAVSSKKAGAAFLWASYGFGDVPEDLYTGKLYDIRELKDYFK